MTRPINTLEQESEEMYHKRQELFQYFLKLEREKEIEPQKLDEYLDHLKFHLTEKSSHEIQKYCLSGLNTIERQGLVFAPTELPFEEGDIAHIDYGPNWINESGYQHMGLILKQIKNKIFVLPMTSNTRTIEKAKKNYINSHLFFLPKECRNDSDLYRRDSAIFINDAKFINPNRIISIVSKVSKNSPEFKKLKKIYSDMFQ